MSGGTREKQSLINFLLLQPLAMLVTLAHGGGRTLSAQESAQFLSLFRRYCGPGTQSPGQDGNTFFYCKTSDQPASDVRVEHEEEITAGETPKQVIFVQPPPTNFVHNVALKGSPGNPQQTEIYVLPQQATHDLQLQDVRSTAQTVKPSLYFLTGDNLSTPPPVAVLPGGQGGNRRPSAPPPNPSNPDISGFGSAGQGGYSTLYGAPGVIAPRNQRNVQIQRQPVYRTL